MLRLQPLEQPRGESPVAGARAASRAVVGVRWRQQWRWRRRRRALDSSDGGGVRCGGGGDGGRVSAAVPAPGGSRARGGPGACPAVCNAAAARRRRAHDVYAGGDGGRAAAQSARGNGRRRHRVAATAPYAGSEQGGVAVHGSGAGGGGGAAAFAVSASVVCATGSPLRDVPIAAGGDYVVPLGQPVGGHARVGLHGDDGSNARMGLDGWRGAAPQHAHAGADRVAGDGYGHDDTLPHAAVGHGPGAPCRDHELAARLGLVLRGPLVAGERRRPAGDGAGDLSGTRLFGSPFPLLPERADGARPHQHQIALRLRQLPPRRRTPPRSPHAALRLRREARRILRRANAKPQPEQIARARQRTSVGGRARPDVLAHPAAKSSLQEAAVAKPAAPRAPRHQQTSACDGPAGRGGRAAPSVASAATDIRSRVSLHVLNADSPVHPNEDPMPETIALNAVSGPVCCISAHGVNRLKTTEFTHVNHKFETLSSQFLDVSRTQSVLHSLILELLVLQKQCYNSLVFKLLVFCLSLRCSGNRTRIDPVVAYQDPVVL